MINLKPDKLIRRLSLKRQEYTHICTRKVIMRKEVITVIGFAFFLLGFLSLFLTLVGLNLSMFSIIEKLPTPFPLVTKLVMIMIGAVLIYTAKFNRDDTRN